MNVWVYDFWDGWTVIEFWKALTRNFWVWLSDEFVGGVGGVGGQLLPHRCHLWLSATAAEDDGDDDWDRPGGQNFKHYSFPIFIHCVLSVLIP